MYCEKHGSKMTLLLTSYVCDECDSPNYMPPIAQAESYLSNLTGKRGLRLFDPALLRYDSTHTPMFYHETSARQVGLIYSSFATSLWTPDLGWQAVFPHSLIDAVNVSVSTAQQRGMQFHPVTGGSGFVVTFTYP